MGMYDDIDCEYPLPLPQYQDNGFQTKCTPHQLLDNYKISKDGVLLHESYDIEDQSGPDAEGIEALVGCMARVNKRWEKISAELRHP